MLNLLLMEVYVTFLSYIQNNALIVDTIRNIILLAYWNDVIRPTMTSLVEFHEPNHRPVSLKFQALSINTRQSSLKLLNDFS